MKTLILYFGLLLPAVGFTQPYSIGWYKISGGGGMSTGATYQVAGTVGQPDAGSAMSGGQYSVTGGFWSLTAVVQTAGLLNLSIAHSGNSVIVWWPTNYAGFSYAGYILQSATNLGSSAVWSTNSPAPVVVNGQNTVTNPITGRQHFYRLSQRLP
jgi:hypothetical protein